MGPHTDWENLPFNVVDREGTLFSPSFQFSRVGFEHSWNFSVCYHMPSPVLLSLCVVALIGWFLRTADWRVLSIRDVRAKIFHSKDFF